MLLGKLSRVLLKPDLVNVFNHNREDHKNDDVCNREAQVRIISIKMLLVDNET